MRPASRQRFGDQLMGSIGIALIHLPNQILTGVTGVVAAPLQKSLGLKRLPTGITGLSPQSPLLGGLDTLAIRAPYHSIIGDRGKGDTPNSSDGVVAYWSSHLAGAQSELIVPGPHGSFALPQTISELKRILHLHLAAVSASPQKGKQKNRLSADEAEQRAGRSLASTRSKLYKTDYTPPPAAKN